MGWGGGAGGGRRRALGAAHLHRRHWTGEWQSRAWTARMVSGRAGPAGPRSTRFSAPPPARRQSVSGSERFALCEAFRVGHLGPRSVCDLLGAAHEGNARALPRRLQQAQARGDLATHLRVSIRGQAEFRMDPFAPRLGRCCSNGGCDDITLASAARGSTSLRGRGGCPRDC